MSLKRDVKIKVYQFCFVSGVVVFFRFLYKLYACKCIQKHIPLILVCLYEKSTQNVLSKQI